MFDVKELELDDVQTHYDEIVKLINISLTESFGDMTYSLTYSSSKVDELIDYVQEDKAKAYVAIENNMCIGFVWSHPIERPNKRRVHIAHIAVLPEKREQGVATALLTAVKDFAQLSGFDGIDLIVSKTDQAALKLYSKLKFETERLMLKKDF